MKRIFTILFLISVWTMGYTQNSFWKESKAVSSNKVNRKLNNANAYKALVLDFQGLKQALSLTGMRGSASSRNTQVIHFPNADGKMEKFSIVEAPTLHPDLAKKYPGIKSYAGQGMDNPTSTIRFSISNQRGFHGLLMTAKGMEYIDPISSDNSTYAIYKRKSMNRDEKDFQCIMDDHMATTTKSKGVTTLKTNDQKLRKYRLALSCSAEYGNIFAGSGTDVEKKANILAQMNITMTRVNGIYERDLAITMELVPNNDEIIYFGDIDADPWSIEWNSKTQQTIDAVIGDANYDIGHNFNTTGGGNAGCIGCVCISGEKGSGYTGKSDPTGDPFDVDYVAHEMGHQFGGYHTMNTCSRSGSGFSEVEPASGSTIMGYAGICPVNIQNNSDAYFGYVNIRDISANIQSGVSSSCPVIVDLSNNPPVANAGNDYTIPKSTPFVLKGTGNDPDGNASLTYCWEQNDPETAPGNGSPESSWSQGPLFRSFEGTSSPDRYMPQASTVLAGKMGSTWEMLPSVSRKMNFSLTVRDNHAGGGQTSDDLMEITVDGDSGPFFVTDPTSSISWYEGQTQVVSWNVANTDQAPISCSNVNILLSTDGGQTFPTTLISNAPNNGMAEVIVPSGLSTNCRIKIEAVGNIFYDISDSDFEIATAVTCNATIPTGLTVTEVNSSDASLTWDQNTGASFDIQYRVQGTSTFTTTGAGSNSKQLLNLIPSTTYEAQIRSKCTGSSSEYSNAVTFTTNELVSNYCSSQGNNAGYEYISSFQLGNISNTTEPSNGYSDHTSISTELVAGTEYAISITPIWNANPYNEGYAVWIDFNQNRDFSDEGELVWSKTPSRDTIVSGLFTVPLSALTGTTRMRVSMKYNGIAEPCESFDYGEVEDYTVNIKNIASLDEVSISSSNANGELAKVGDEVTLQFHATKSIQAPSVTIQGNDVAASLSEGVWVAKYTFTSADSEGKVTFTINYTDIEDVAGEEVTTTTDESTVRFDKTAPTLSSVTISSNNSYSPAVAITENTISVLFTPNEEISTPVVTIADSLATIQANGETWIATYSLTKGDAEGEISFKIEYADLAGNKGTPISTTTDASAVTYDKTPPVLSDITISSNNLNRKWAKTGDMITLSFKANEEISTPVVNINNSVAATTFENDVWSATYTLKSEDIEGEISFTIDYKDLPGNMGDQAFATTDESSVKFDKTPPTLENVSIKSANISDKGIATPDDEVTLSFKASEKIDNPDVAIADTNVSASLVESQWRAIRTMRNGDTPGVIAFSISYKDLAGNEALVTTTSDGSSVEFVEEITGLEDRASKQVKAYPNPASHEIIIQTEGIYGSAEIRVIDFTGRKVLSKTVEVNRDARKTIDVTSLANGTYTLQVVGNSMLNTTLIVISK
ncbi:T9SS type A sorting domain-containing protein [Fulvivirga sp. 29W222]|uniref:T9SS type A sorting domain-containing protein n=1 Tax=Fulvivirga marina TaxID=2494733 RepID=A0A937FVR1_9BACT|nr:zinc-dependent metalloprotease family protein [Fulvivirga marina]MBL6445437.1 T9SS type A sorting domain-containing protein [Fulvivirga marina]